MRCWIRAWCKHTEPRTKRPGAVLRAFSIRSRISSTELLVGHHQVLGDHVGGAALDVVALHEMNEFAILEQRDARAARWVKQEVLSGLVCRVGIDPGEHGNKLGGAFRTGQ